MQLGSLTRQIGAQSFTGAASVLAIIQQASPIVTALLIAGAGGSAICADIGSRKIREEIDAMEVLGVSPIHRLVVPRVLATMLVSVLLNGMVSVVGVLGGYFFNVIMQDGTPGAYLASFSALAQLPDLWISELKALIFGFIAGIVAAYRGLNPAGGPKGVGDAVNQAVVITFLLLFILLEGPMLGRRIGQLFGPGAMIQAKATGALAEMSNQVRTYLVWRTIVNCGLAIVLGIFYRLMGLSEPWAWARLSQRLRAVGARRARLRPAAA